VLSPALVINTAPLAGNLSLNATQEVAAEFALASLLEHCSDPENDPLAVLSVHSPSSAGGTLSLSALAIVYTPPTNYNGNDIFTFVVQDTFGGTATGTVSVAVAPGVPERPGLSGIVRQNDGTMEIQGSGTPGRAYLLQVAPDLTSWSTLATNAASTGGQLLFIDLEATNHPVRFYRLAVP
jgi:hypothetical protein